VRLMSGARLRLTVWYFVILAAVVAMLSVALYRLINQVHQADLQGAHRVSQHYLSHLFADDKRVLAYQLLAVDVVVLAIAVAGAYLLAGRTLRPVTMMIDRQRRFAAAAGHELRTPLTALQGNVEVALMEERTAEEYAAALSETLNDVVRMSEIIENILPLAHPDADGDLLRVQPVDLRTVLTDAIDAVLPLAIANRQTIEIALAEPLPVEVDLVKVRQAFVNLLENAVAYTPESGLIMVSGRCERGQAVIAVRDTGPGVDPEHAPHLFEPFYRSDTARSSAQHAGLGLSLAAWTIEAHGGRIELRSTPGRGALFLAAIPLRRDGSLRRRTAALLDRRAWRPS
jgi:signal transduction histidine kinase